MRRERRRRVLAAWCACVLGLGAAGAAARVDRSQGSLVAATTAFDDGAVAAPAVGRSDEQERPARVEPPAAGAQAGSSSAEPTAVEGDGARGPTATADAPAETDASDILVPLPDRPPAVPNLGDSNDPGWTGISGVARIADGTRTDLCGVISDRAGTWADLRLRPGVPFDVAFPPRSAVAVWLGVCGEGPTSPEHAAIETSVSIASGRPTTVDWTIQRNEIIVDAVAVDAAGAPVVGLCVVVDDQPNRTDASGRVRTTSAWGPRATLQWGWGCPAGGNWRLGEPTSIQRVTGEPGGTVEVRWVLPANPNDSFGSPWPGWDHLDLSSAGATVQPGEPMPTCAGVAVGSLWFELTAGPWSTGITPNVDGIPAGAYLALWEGDSLDALVEVACVPYPVPLPMGPATDVGPGQHVHAQLVLTGEPFTFFLHLHPR